MNWKHRLRYPLDIRKARQALAAKPSVGDDKPLGIDLYNDTLLFDCGRHLAAIAAHARQAGFRVLIRCEPALLARIAHKKLGCYFLSMPHVTWIEPGGAFPKQTLVLTDAEQNDHRRPRSDQRSVRLFVGRRPVEDSDVMPYPMHPKQIVGLSDDRLAELREVSKAGLFFAGNMKKRYGRDTLMRRFGVMSRLQLIDTIRSTFGDRVATREAEGRTDRIVLRDSRTDPIDGSQWMSVLARHRFFLCCPGASQPVCHNAVEAMAVGTVPVLEYGNRFHPALRDGENAICFSGRMGLIDAVERIDAMNLAQRERLSQAAADYFDRHGRGRDFLKRLDSVCDGTSLYRVSMPFHDRDLFAEDSPKTQSLGRPVESAA